MAWPSFLCKDTLVLLNVICWMHGRSSGLYNCSLFIILLGLNFGGVGGVVCFIALPLRFMEVWVITITEKKTGFGYFRCFLKISAKRAGSANGSIFVNMYYVLTNTFFVFLQKFFMYKQIWTCFYFSPLKNVITLFYILCDLSTFICV